jgi:hypothetical protein
VARSIPFSQPSKDIPSSDDDGEFHPEADDFFDLLCDLADDFRVNPEASVAGQNLSTDLQENPSVSGFRHGGLKRFSPLEKG